MAFRPFGMHFNWDKDPNQVRLALAQDGQQFMFSRVAGDPEDFQPAFWVNPSDENCPGEIRAVYFSDDEREWARLYQRPPE